MRYTLVLIGICTVWQSDAQALREINFSYLYNMAESYSFSMQPVRKSGGWDVFYRLQLKDSSSSTSRFVIEWELRESFSSDKGIMVESVSRSDSQNQIDGKASLPVQSSEILLIANIRDSLTSRSRIFYRLLEPDYPINGYLSNASTGELHTESYVPTGERVSIRDFEQQVFVSYFNDAFPAASPVFSDAMAQVAQAIEADSVFFADPDGAYSFGKEGLYLVQMDTTASSGFAFRVEDDYPKYSKLQSLYGPMVYITTKPEYERLKSAGTNKKAFDKVILGITRDAERARNFMRAYFRRVVMANTFFTSYKEGWKTDRGMVCIIFGLPEEVSMSEDSEVWKYDNDQHKLSFTFVRSATLFDPDNFVLHRDRKYQRIWYETVDLWRNARF